MRPYRSVPVAAVAVVVVVVVLVVVVVQRDCSSFPGRLGWRQWRECTRQCKQPSRACGVCGVFVVRVRVAAVVGGGSGALQGEEAGFNFRVSVDDGVGLLTTACSA